MEFHLSHLLVWLVVLVTAGTTYIIGIVVYRLFFHPLAAYPGPILARATGLYQLYHARKGDRHLEFWRLHQKYGPVVRFAPNSLSFNTATALKDIYGFKANVRKSDFYDAFVHPAPNTHNTRDKEVHARKRRVLSHAFSDSAIKGVERYILDNINTFCSEIGPKPFEITADFKGWSAPRNMADWCNWLAMDILGDLCFGKAFHMLERPDNRYAIELVGNAARRHLICGTMLIIDTLGLDKILFRKIATDRARYVSYSRAQLAERAKLGEDTDRRDFFYHLLKARDPQTGRGFTTPELWGESNLLIIAGSDTTSTAMAATLFYLVRDPEALEFATAEVRATFPRVEHIRQGKDLADLKYLRACIDEAMRLSPSVGGLLPREVLPGGATIDGQQIPEGTIVGTGHYALHHNPDYYPDPFAFKPERWLASSKTLTTAQSAFCAFSVGPRGCIGKGLAYAEMLLTLATMLFQYDLRKAVHVGDPGEGREGAEAGRHRPGEFQLIDTFTSLKNGPMVEFRVRTKK